MTRQVRLKRVLSTPRLTLYDLGTIFGAGIYVLVGEVAGKAGMYAPAAYFVAAVIALFSGLTYAELCARHRSAQAKPPMSTKRLTGRG